MRLPISRIEYEYILQTFIEDHPPLFLQSGTLFYTLSPDAYTVQQFRILFTAPPELHNKPVIVFFDHKKRSISFDSYVMHKPEHSYLLIPDALYKYDPDAEQRNMVTTEIHIPDKDTVTAAVHELFPVGDPAQHIDSGFAVPKSELYRIYSRVAWDEALQQMLTNDVMPLFLYRMYEFERKVSAVFNPKERSGVFVLFIDSTFLICGCRKNYATLLAGKGSALQFTMHFPHRRIHVAKGRLSFSYRIESADISIIGFAFQDMFEEDRRFLYEYTYPEKYNPLLLQASGS